jgi:hypothetical protein
MVVAGVTRASRRSESPTRSAPSSKPGDHLGLNVDRDHAALWPDEPGKFESEEPHAGAGLKDGHSGLDEWSEDAHRILPELAHGARQM